MLNYIKADLYRTSTRVSFYVWLLALIALPMLIIVGTRTVYASETVVSVVPSVVYLIFALIALVVSDYSFREDMQHGLYKNDTTSGVSRTGIYMAKFLTGVLLMAVMWVFCSASCILAAGFGHGWTAGMTLLKNMASLTTLVWFVQTIMYLSLFQAIGTVVKNTVALLGICILISALFTNVGGILGDALPGIVDFFNTTDATGSFGNSLTVNFLKSLIMPTVGTGLLLLIGNMIFGRKEL
jgi:ABC-type transport system involved in cytochrome c biogenesis permease component